jgi:hypothetical protein
LPAELWILPRTRAVGPHYLPPVRQIDLGPCDAVLYEEQRERWAVVLPGAGYTTQAPLLWFARELALAHGWGAIEVRERGAAGGDSLAWARERAERALAEAGDREALVIGKSRSSLAAPVAVERDLPAIWLTPLLGQPAVREALAATQRPALLVGSRADPSWGSAAPVANPELRVLELEGLDHSLQQPGDPFASLAVLQTVAGEISTFLAALAV